MPGVDVDLENQGRADQRKVGRDCMTYEKERNKIIETCLKLQKAGYFPGTWGNVSIRCGDVIIITPSRICYNIMKPEDLTIIDIDGKITEGIHPPSSEKEVHRQIYQNREDIYAIVHAHTPYAMAASAMEIEAVPCLVEEMSQLLGGSIPVTQVYVPAKEHARLGEAAAAAIGNKNGVLLKNHGPVSCGRDIEESVLTAEIIEKVCQIYLSVSRPDRFCPIPEPFISSERNRYLYQYGKENT